MNLNLMKDDLLKKKATSSRNELIARIDRGVYTIGKTALCHPLSKLRQDIYAAGYGDILIEWKKGKYSNGVAAPIAVKPIAAPIEHIEEVPKEDIDPTAEATA